MWDHDLSQSCLKIIKRPLGSRFFGTNVRGQISGCDRGPLCHVPDGRGCADHGRPRVIMIMKPRVPMVMPMFVLVAMLMPVGVRVLMSAILYGVVLYQ